MKEFIKKNWHNIVLGIVLSIYIFAQIYSFNDMLSEAGDNAKYIILAKSMLQGTGYREINDPNMPEHLGSPPFFSIMLIPIIALFGINISILKIYMIGLSILTLFIVYVVINKLGGKYVALTITSMMAFSFQYFHWSHRIMSEVPFILFSFLTFYYLLKEKGWHVILFMLITILTKATSIVLIPTVVIYLLLKKKYKYAFIIFFCTSFIFGLWVMHNTQYTSLNYINSYKYVDPYNPERGLITFTGLFNRAYRSGLNYINNFSHMIFHYNEIIYPSFFLIDALILLPMVFGFVMLILQKKYFFPLYFTFFMGILLIYPWQTIRFVVPLMPVVYYFLIYGILNMIKLFKENVSFKTKYLFYVILVCLVLLQLPSFLLKINMDKNYTYDEPMQKYKLIAEWAKDNVEDDAVILARKPYLFYIWSGGKHTRLYPYSTSSGVWWQAIINSDYLVYDELSSTTQLYLNPVIEQMSFMFSPVYYIQHTALFKISGNEPIFEEEK